MTAKRILVAAAAVVVLAAAAGLWWVYLSKDELLRTAIERYAPEMTGVPVSVESVKIEPLEGRGLIGGLRVGNPKGFSAPNALVLGEIRLAIDPATVTSNVVVLKEVVLVSPEVTYERSGGSSNVEVIQKNIERYVERTLGKSEGPGKKFVIDNLYVRSGKVGYDTALTVPLPDLHLRDIGRKTNGATAGEVVKQTWGAIARSALNLTSRAGSAIKKGAEGAFKGVQGLFK